MKQLIECVPNISEGRNQKIISEIVRAAEIPGVFLLDVDSGVSANRTVITLVGTPEHIAEAAFRLIQRASELIDMRNHQGEHPCIGATDVCPFVPYENVSMEECSIIARQLGKRVSEELKIPIYLYGKAKAGEERTLAAIRRGGYESLQTKIQDPKEGPDFSPPVVHPTAGATIIGSRDILIAYNINLNTGERKIARQIAKAVRKKHCLAIGWYIAEYEMAQVSTNLTDYHAVSLHSVFDEVSKVARDIGVEVKGSEVIGLVPEAALIDTGKHAERFPPIGVTKDDTKPLIQAATKYLSLSSVREFRPLRKILEYRVREVVR